MAIKKMSDVKWEEVRKRLVSLGIQVITDVNPETTVSGYLDGHRFAICWLDGTSTCTLKIKKVRNIDFPAEDQLVKAMSEILLGSNPFVMYENKNQKGFKLREWRRKEFQAARLEALKRMKDVSELKELN